MESCEKGVIGCQPCKTKGKGVRITQFDIKPPIPPRADVEYDPTWTGERQRGRQLVERRIAPRSASTTEEDTAAKDEIPRHDMQEWNTSVEQSVEQAAMRTDIINSRKRKRLLGLHGRKQSHSESGLRELILPGQNDLMRVDPNLPQLRSTSDLRRYHDPAQRTDYLISRVAEEQ